MTVVYGFWIVVFGVGVVWLGRAAMRSTGLVLRTAAAIAAAGLFSLGLSLVFSFAAGCVDGECNDPRSSDLAQTIGYVAIAIAVVLLIAGTVMRKARSSRRGGT
jgi:Ni/Fe-hydrogenase subunit HybB-like protein